MPEPERSGILLVDKPSGPTSHDVVERARRALDQRRVGHTGTLDPFATGLLILCVGPSTRLAEYFHLPSKRYRAVLRLGIETTTHDPEGEPVGQEDLSWRNLGRDEVEEAVAGFRGTILQRPPAFSARRVDGRRAHRAAREGEEVELEAREVRVHELDVLETELHRVTLAARVSTGTYVRSLARDIGRALGCGAHLTSLRRTAIGPFGVEEALPADELEPGTWATGPSRAKGSAPASGAPSGAGDAAWRSPADALSFLPRRELSGPERDRVVHGARISAGRPEEPPSVDGDDLPVVLIHEGELVAVAERADGELQPRKVLRGPD